MKYLIIIGVIMAMFSCTGSEEETDPQLKDEFKKGTPAWVSVKFFKAFCEREYAEAEKYGDKTTKQTLRTIDQWSEELPDYEYVKVDSCEQYEDYAYCYCRYNDESREEINTRLLLVDIDGNWRVHFEKGDESEYNNWELYDRTAILNKNAPNSLNELEEGDINLLQEFSSTYITETNDPDFVVGYMNEELLQRVVPEVICEFESDYCSRSIAFGNFYCDYTYQFDGLEVSAFSVEIEDIYLDEFAGYDFLIRTFVKEYGHPYNALEIPVEELFKYESLRWFTKGYNQELEISKHFDWIGIKLRKAI